MQADDLRFGQQLRQAQITGAQRFDLRVWAWVIRQQLATEAVHDFGEGRADLPGADHADGLAHQIETGQPMQAEIAFAGAIVGAVQTAVECQDQRHRVFGHGMGRVGRNAHDRQAQAFGRCQVDMVVTGRAQGDQACAAGGQAFEHRGAEVIIDEGADHLVMLGQRCRIEAQSCRLKVQLDARWQVGGKKTVTVVGLAAEKNRAHAVLLNTDVLALSRIWSCRRLRSFDLDFWRSRSRPRSKDRSLRQLLHY
ncbi:hypothetical protein D3C87_1322900 [compost metagenome]